MTAAKLLSARLPLPRLLRKSRIGDRAAPIGAAVASAADATGGCGRGDGTGNGELDSLSGVIRVEDTILFSWQLTLRIDCIELIILNWEKKDAARISR
jgi:hypothetical protein